jgi:hypothetical protein
MKKTKKARSWYSKLIRAGVTIISIVVILLTGGSIFLSNYIPGVLRTKITYMVVNGSDSLYKCSIGKIAVNILQGEVSVEDLNIILDSTKYHEQKLSGKIPDITFELSMIKGSIKGLQVFPLIFSKKIKIKDIEIDNANVILCRQDKKNQANKEPDPTEESMWRMIQPHISGIYVNSVQLNKTKFSYRNSENKKELSLTYKDCSLSLKNIRIDSIGAANSSRILFTEDIAIMLTGVSYFTDDSLYNIKTDSLSYSSFYKLVNIKNATISPTVPFIEFTKRHGMQTDIFDLSIPHLTAKNFKIDKIFTNNEICLDTIILNQPIVTISRDRTALSDTTSQLGKYPNEALLCAPMVLRIPLVLLNDAELHYIERQKLTLKMAHAFFTKINGSITNITNSKEDLEKNGHCMMKLDGFFLKNGKLNTVLDFDLASPDGDYTATANLGHVNVNELNSLFVPFANLKLKTFHLDGGHLSILGNNKELNGKARLLYTDLSIEILAPDKKTHQMKKQGFISFLANLVAIRSNNETGEKEVIANNIHVDRKAKQPFGNLLWEFLFEAMKKIILKVPAKDLKVEM